MLNIVSRDTRESLLKAFSVITAVATILSLSGVVALAATPADYGLKEGDVISAAGSDDPDVYIVNEHGYKRLFLNPAIFGFYGHLGGFAAVKNVSPATRDAFPTSGLFRNCESGDQKVYGVEVTGEDVAVLHWVNTTGAQAVADDPNFFQKVFCINNNEFNWYAKGAEYTSVSQVPDYSRQPGQPATGLSASLAGSNPASGVVIAGQALADLAHFQVNGSGSVTSVELQRLGVSGDDALSDVFLFVNGVRVTDSGSVSQGKITFNNPSGLFNAPAVVSVRAGIGSGVSGQTVGVGLRMLNATPVSVNGNVHSVAANPGDLATASLTAVQGPGASIDPQNDVDVWRSTLNISKNVYLKRLTLRDLGSINAGDIRNFRLFVNGVQVASTANLVADGKYAHLVLSGNGQLLTSNAQLRVVADVIGGASRTIQFSLRGYYDLDVVDANYNVAIKATGVPAEPTATTINAGSVTVIKATDSPAENLVKGSSDAVLARYTMTGYGEAIKIDRLTVMATTSEAAFTSLRNARILINGAQYGSTANITTNPSATGREFNVNYTLQPGSPVTVEVRADLKNSAGTDLAAGKNVTVTLKAGSSNAQKQVSGATLNVPTANVPANALNVVEGSMTLSKSLQFNNQTVTVPQSGLKLAHFVLVGNTNEDINVNTIDLSFTLTASWSATNITDVKVMVDGQQNGPVRSTVTAATQSLPVNFTLAKNGTRQIEIYANVSDIDDTGSTVKVNAKVHGTTVQSSQNVFTGFIAGQLLTDGAGSLNVSADSAVDKLALGNSAVTNGTFRFKAQDDTFRVTELVFRVETNDAPAAQSVTLKDGTSALGTQSVVQVASGSYYATFTGLNIMVNSGTEKALSTDINTSVIGGVSATTGKNVKVTLTSYKYRGQGGSAAESTITGPDLSSANIYVHKSYPTVTHTAVSSTLQAGVQPVAQFTVAPTGDTVGLKRFLFDVSKTTAVTIASGSIRIYENGVDITTLASISGSGSGIGLGGAATSGTVTIEFNGERTISSATTYRIDANVASGVSTGNSLVFNLNQDTAKGNPSIYNSVASTKKFVWSDRSANGVRNDSTGADWMDGALVQSLPLSWGKSLN